MWIHIQTWSNHFCSQKPNLNPVTPTTPVLRAKYQGFRRNVAIALGNARLETARAALLDCAANESDAVVREAAQWALSQF